MKKAFQKGIAWPDATNETITTRLQRQLTKIPQLNINMSSMETRNMGKLAY